jgi:hypothetical protein
MNNKTCLLTLLLVILFVVFPTAALADKPVSMGGLKLNEYCAANGYSGATFLTAVLDPAGNVVGGVIGPNYAYNNWRCKAATGAVRPINMEQACKWTLGFNQVQAHPTDPNNVYTWVCYSSQNKK